MAQIYSALDNKPAGFVGLPQFRDKVPLNSISDPAQYTGDFPFLTFDGTISNIEGCCEFEISSELFQVIEQSGITLPWAGASRPDTFAKYLTEGQLGKAWLVLNSKGWAITEARKAIADLADVANNPSFDELALAWLSVADPKVGGY